MKINEIPAAEFEAVLGGRKIICFGASQMLEEAMRTETVRGNTIYVVDNDAKKHNRRFCAAGKELSVFPPEKLISEDMSDKVILICSSWFEDIIRQLAELKDTDCFVWPLMRLAALSDRETFFRERIADECLKEYRAALEQQGVTDKNIIESKLAEKEAYILGKGKNERPLVLPRIMVLPTTRCNMRCKGCSSLLPLAEKTEDVPVSELVRDLEKVFAAADECIRVTVGGEPFLYSGLPELLEYLLSQKKVLSVLLITNSTIKPTDELLKLLDNRKIFVEISDYGHIEKMSRTVAALENSGARFTVLTDQVWQDMGGTESRGRSEDELRKVYLNCEQSRIMKAVCRGRIYTCARSARMHALKFYSSERDFIELHDKTAEELRSAIREFYMSDTADACDHCDLGAFPVRTIEAGVQMTGKTVKSDYTIIRRDEYERLKFLEKYAKAQEENMFSI